MTQATFNAINSKSSPNGTTFVALYSDGSGAALFMITDDGELCSSNDGPLNIMTPDTHLLDSGFLYWMPLPDTFKLWFETAEEKRP